MNAKMSPRITTLSLTMRRFVLEDTPKVLAMSQESGMRAWLPDQVYESERAALDVLRYLIAQYRDPGTPARAPYVLGICLTSSLELIGHVGLSPLHEQVEVGYAVESRYQGRGFASEAVRTVSEWGMQRFDLLRVLGIVTSDNTASCKVLQHAGFDLVDESMGSLHGRSGLVRTYQKEHQIANGCGCYTV
jgi:ribosomal-protein-alanine N-acetyltransferase